MQSKPDTRAIIIAGGAGFIGSHLVERLIREGKRVIVIDSLVSGKKEYLDPDAEFHELDMGDPRVRDIVKKEHPQFVYNFAGPVHFRKPIDDPLFNEGLHLFESTKKLLDYSLQAGIEKFIFSSSGGAIDSGAVVVPTPEDYLAHPSSLYGLMSLAIERLIERYVEKGLSQLTLRLSNVYGPRQWESGIIPSCINNILRGSSPVIRGDGEETLDFIYVDDVIDAFLLAGETGKTGIFNVGSSGETSVNEAFRLISKKLSWAKEPDRIPQKEQRAKRNVLDCGKIKKELGWDAKTTLEDGLNKTVQWYQNQQLALRE